MDISERQRPVVANLSQLLEKAKWTAAAISDNAIEEQLPIPRETLSSFANDLYQIKAHLETAFEIEH